ncbi:hypothetical protein DFH06DRAFT_112855 [Mycena polygramma]|nr:hypothetical protein DFH06DRAFT_112855 [Mycena polygramma]
MATSRSGSRRAKQQHSPSVIKDAPQASASRVLRSVKAQTCLRATATPAGLHWHCSADEWCRCDCACPGSTTSPPRRQPFLSRYRDCDHDCDDSFHYGQGRGPYRSIPSVPRGLPPLKPIVLAPGDKGCAASVDLARPPLLRSGKARAAATPGRAHAQPRTPLHGLFTRPPNAIQSGGPREGTTALDSSSPHPRRIPCPTGAIQAGKRTSSTKISFRMHHRPGFRMTWRMVSTLAFSSAAACTPASTKTCGWSNRCVILDGQDNREPLMYGSRSRAGWKRSPSSKTLGW